MLLSLDPVHKTVLSEIIIIVINNNNNNKIYLNSEHSRKLKAYKGQPRAKQMHTLIAPHLTITTKAI